MHCKFCGSFINDNVKFCGHCGAKIEHQNEKIANRQGGKRTSRKIHKYIFILILFGLLCAGIGIVGICVIMDKRSDKEVGGFGKLIDTPVIVVKQEEIAALNQKVHLQYEDVLKQYKAFFEIPIVDILTYLANYELKFTQIDMDAWVHKYAQLSEADINNSETLLCRFAYYDINKDGIDELVISEESDISSNRCLTLYAWNGYNVQMLSGNNVSKVELCLWEDGTISRVQHFESPSIEFYSIVENDLTKIMELQQDVVYKDVSEDVYDALFEDKTPCQFDWISIRDWEPLIVESEKYVDKHLNGNLSFGGIAAENKTDIVYVANITRDEQGLYVLNKDNLQVELLCQAENIQYLNIYDEYIFFTCYQNNAHRIMRLNLNDSYDCRYIYTGFPNGLTVYKDYCYFSDSNTIYRCDLYGENLTQLLNMSNYGTGFCIADDRIYYVLPEIFCTGGTYVGRVFSMNLEGQDRTEIISLSDVHNQYLYTDGEHLFFEFMGKPYRCKIDGSEMTQLFDYSTDINVCDGEMYRGDIDGLYHCNNETKEWKKLTENGADNICVLNDWIVFTDINYAEYETGSTTRMIRKDGTGEILLNDIY